MLSSTMDSSKRRLSGPGPTGTSQKRPNVSAPGAAVEDEAIEEQMALLPESPEDDADDIDQHMLEEDLELHLGEAGRNWERPAPPPLDPSMQSLGEVLHMHCSVVSLCCHQHIDIACGNGSMAFHHSSTEILVTAKCSLQRLCVPASAAFQQLEVDYYIGAPNQQVFRTDLLETPIIRMYGVTEHGVMPLPVCFCWHTTLPLDSMACRPLALQS